MKKLSLIALVAVLLVGLNSCQYKNPALEDSQNPMVKEFEVANLLLGKTHAEAEKTLKDLGYTVRKDDEYPDQYECERRDGNVDIELLFKLGSKNKICAAMIDFEPEAADTYLKEFSKLKEVVTTFNSNLQISTKEECAFAFFLNSAEEGGKMDYNTMLSRIDSSTNGFDCAWMADAESLTEEQIVANLETGNATCVNFFCYSTDYMSYGASIIVASEKYK